ncbi:holo-ACP synthase [Bacillus sp. JCM 19041]|uniref:holo-ACP synthase n=1 Tax=Bacillus sp. JCM 19041 TaxID=1460637 RepID=UPI0006CF59A3
MIVGIGLDIIELERIKSVLQRQPRFAKRILTRTELSQMNNLTPYRQTEFLAGRFAAKEAYAKAKGTGIGAYLSFQDIEVVIEESGKPVIVSGVVGEKAHLSITHSNQFAAAQVVIESFR